MNNKIDRLVKRLRKLNINIELGLNYPWVYLTAINGVLVTETYYGEHGYTICFYHEKYFLNLKHLFKLIRRYCD